MFNIRYNQIAFDCFVNDVLDGCIERKKALSKSNIKNFDKKINKTTKDALIKYHEEEIRPLDIKKLREVIIETKRLFNWLTDKKIEEIIKVKPNEMMDIYDDFKKFKIKMHNGIDVFSDEGVKSNLFSTMLSYIFNYDSFSGKQKKAYALANNLNLKVCPYCNREYIHTVLTTDSAKDEYIVRPDFDHYIPKSIYPMFGLSFYNLIPSGKICNSSIKGTRELNIKNHLHPYIDEDKDFCFHLDIDEILTKKVKAEVDIVTDGDGNKRPKVDNTIEFFKLKDLYENHNNLAEDIYNIYIDNSPKRLKDLADKYSYLDSWFDLDRLIETCYNKFIVNDPDNEILGKLRDDLYKQMRKYYD